MADYQDQWPIAAFHFRVEIGGEQMSFQEVSGLDQEAQIIEYRHGDSEIFSTIKRAGIIKYPNLVLKKGIFDTDSRLIDIFSKIYEKEYYGDEGSRLDISVQLLDETGDIVMSWNIHRAVPVKLTGPTMKSDSNEVAIESIEFAYESLTAEAG
ncbi:MAG: phage tail protein [Bacteroidia bacterium]